MVPIATWEITSNDDPYMSIGLSIYCAGCNRDCPECHSPDLQDSKAGIPMSPKKVFNIINNRIALIENVCFLGGEWLLYPEDLKEIVDKIYHYTNLKIILYTGELIENIPRDILRGLDIIIDGPYEKELKTEYKVPASSNQRVFIKIKQDLYDYSMNSYIHVQIDPSVLLINRE